MPSCFFCLKSATFPAAYADKPQTFAFDVCEICMSEYRVDLGLVEMPPPATTVTTPFWDSQVGAVKHQWIEDRWIEKAAHVISPPPTNPGFAKLIEKYRAMLPASEKHVPPQSEPDDHNGDRATPAKNPA